MRFYIICLATLIICAALCWRVEVRHGLLSEDRTSKWTQLTYFEIDGLDLKVEKGDNIAFGVSGVEATENGEIKSIWLTLCVNNAKAYEVQAVAAPSENQPKTWPEAADRDMKIELKY
jgi:hypothetical protein